MFAIVKKTELAERLVEFEVEAPLIARAAKPGNFVLVRVDERAERIPLTIGDSDAERGVFTLVVQEVGKSTARINAKEEGDAFRDVVGPLGKDREIAGGGKTVACVAGGVGVAPMYPQTKAYHETGNRVISIIGARTKDLLFWRDRVEAASDEVYYSTDDGSFGHHGFAAEVLEELIQKGQTFDEAVAIGPVPHMKAVTEVCRKHSIPVVVSLNPIMVDGTGMCGGCRVTVNGETRYACVDGPEFDGAGVDFDELISRQSAYRSIERRGIDRTAPAGEGEGHACHLEKQAEEAVLDTPGAAVAEPEAPASRVEAPSPPGVPPRSFDEVARGFTEEEAVAEANRCLRCKKPKCVGGCPVEIDIPGFIGAIQERDFARAARILKNANSLPAVCGRVCPQETQCERACVLARKGDPVAIGKLERFVADWEAAHVDAAVPDIARKDQKVAVIGSGPGGLTCAGDLAKLGYDVTIFEAFHATGGVLRYGIPEFRLPKSIVDREVEYVKSLGVKIELNMVIGKVLTVEDLLKDGFSAVFIAVGAGAPIFLGIPGENLGGVLSANELLTRVNLMKAYKPDEYDTPVIVGDKVAVIGAGNVAMDAARVALRLGATEVSIVYRRSEAEVPARAAEVEHAKLEGVKFKLLTSPIEILGDENNHVKGMKCIRMELGEPDASGRRRPVPIPDSEFVIDCDMVIPALGTQANPILTSNTEGIALNRWGNIVVDSETGASNIPGVYAGGDIVTGAATVIEAMGAGRVAARSIHEYLSGEKTPAAV